MKIHTVYQTYLWEVLEMDTETRISRRVALCQNEADARQIVFALLMLNASEATS